MVNKYRLTRYLQLVFAGYLGSIGLSIFSLKALAQSNIVQDNTLGAESSQIIPNLSVYGLPSEVILGGATRGINLFHSFQEFNVRAGRGAYFLVPDASIQNIFARVTGNSLSEISGTLGTLANSQPNLFLMNPNGIIFGRNAQLDVGGSFVATTANAIQFPGGAEFSLTSSVPSGNALLSVNPTAFLFNQIANQGANSIENRGVLRVPNNKSLILLGGNVAPTPDASGQILMDGGILGALGGRVEIAGLAAPGSVEINVDDNNLSLSFPDGVARTNISLINNSGIFTNGAGGGDIIVNANNLSLVNSRFFAGIRANQGTPETKAGDISINATGIVTLAEDSLIGNTSAGIGDSGNINIVGQSLKMINGGRLDATSQQGNSGIINIIVDDTVALSGKDTNLFPSAIFSDGGINIQARNLSLANGAFINSVSIRNLSLADGVLTNPNNLLVGNSGDVKIQATDSISLNEASISTSTFGEGNAGNLSILTNRLSLDNDSFIASDTFGSGNGANLNINARDILLNQSFISASSLSGRGISDVGNAGDINIETERITITNSGRISSDSEIPAPGQIIGSAGNLTINTGNLLLINGVISSSTFGQGSAGNISIFSNDGVLIDNGLINSSVGFGGVGNGGDINIQTQKLTLINGGGISSSIFGAFEDLPAGQGNSGNIRIDATDAVTISGDSGILTATLGILGQGGDIIVNTDYFRLSDNATISSATGNSSNAGNVIINARAVEVLNGALIVTGTQSSGKAGDITINATDKITIFSNSNLNTRTGLFANTDPTSSGDAGNISLFTTDFNLSATNSNFSDPVAVVTSSLGEGVAGDINIVATANFNANNGLVSARSEKSGGGNININAENIRLRNNSDIRTDLSSSNGKGGNISLSADIIIALEDSDILAFAPEGQGGDIRFNTRAVFSDSLYNPRQTTSDRNSLQSLRNNNRSDINATGTVSGNIIGVPDISFIQNGLTELQNNPIDTNALIANSCIARSPKQEGTFVITGTGGLPNRPGEAAASSYPTGDVQSVTNNSAASSWKKGEPIVEPQGVYRLANGDLVMSRECR